MPFTNIEFFSFENEIWYRRPDGSINLLDETANNIISEILEHIATFYPKAYEALSSEYKGCALNLPYYRYRIVTRFIRCNFAQLDNIPDLSERGICNFEFVSCPLRGECKYENIICRPTFDHKLSTAEIPVMKLWYDGLNVDGIAEQLHLSPHTINNHIRNAYQRLNLHSRAEFMRYASQAKLFS